MAPSMKLKLGDRVEVHERGHASSGPYFPATVIRTPLKMKPHVTLLYVEYGIRTSSSDHHNPLENPLREIVNADNVRPPLLPAKELVVFKEGDDVEFFFRNRWFRGVVVSVNVEGLRYTVRLHDSTRPSVMVCLHHNLRLHREWNNGAWNPPLPQDFINLQMRTNKIRTKKDPLKVKVKVKSMKVKSSTTPIKDNSLMDQSSSTSNNKPLNNITIKEEIIFKDECSVV
ncbi:hypothetical protein CsatB_025941 [Cannabis sativa]